MVRRYGGLECLALTTVPVPELGPDDVLIRVQATTVSSGDRRLRAMDFPRGMRTIGRLIFGIRGPRQPILGTECTGTIVQLGSRVTQFAVGDAVIAFTDAKGGAHAEYCRISAQGMIIRRPANLKTEHAAALCFGGITALDFIRRCGVAAQSRVLVIGASGAVGSACVQLAVRAGAHVTASTSTANVALAKALGAHEVIDYTQQDLLQLSQQFDVVLDTVGALDFKRSLPLLVEHGRYAAINGGLADMLRTSRGTRRCIAGPAKVRRAYLEELVQLAAEGAFVPLIDSVTAFADLPQAHARADSGRKRGSAVVLVAAEAMH